MNTAQPIRNKEDLALLKDYYYSRRPNMRNYLLIITGLNTALRISDIIGLQWKDVFDFQTGSWKEHITLIERKTDKSSAIFLNRNITQALKEYKAALEESKNPVRVEGYLFSSHDTGLRPISRIQAFRIIKKAASACHIEGAVSCHSLRKTFGYFAWKQGVPPVLLMNIYNHSSFRVTRRYLGIEQDDRDKIYENIML